MSLRDGIDVTPGGFLYRQAPRKYCGSNTDRHSVGDPGHCEDCCSVGHVVAHPDLGCGDVGCYSDHADKPITYAGPTGREKPGEHWNARILREHHEVEQARALSTDPTTPYRLSPAGVLVWRDLRREPGWMQPHWTVLQAPAGDVRHYVGQHLPDQAVAGWSPLVRRGTS